MNQALHVFRQDISLLQKYTPSFRHLCSSSASRTRTNLHRRRDRQLRKSHKRREASWTRAHRILSQGALRLHDRVGNRVERESQAGDRTARSGGLRAQNVNKLSASAIQQDSHWCLYIPVSAQSPLLLCCTRLSRQQQRSQSLFEVFPRQCTQHIQKEQDGRQLVYRLQRALDCDLHHLPHIQRVSLS